ncbi:beta-lactamase/transpeptidase-like protein [Dendrothele bispora CBS 962.96]|uniref:Beta-lactamase/transpeptidase-like protein n=1 Tax=Dendrothele bispora (strain CBS 962.96) TaxID=1314807 RepID=A0A4S8MYG2_DENBC|nr:beta-lactamase/transpeptidase-like protein [Dendrothele bispora CBS 962.96]
MESFRTAIREAVGELGRERQEIPGVVLVSGKGNSEEPVIRESYGYLSLDSGAPLDLQSTFWLASCTKLLTTIACLQLVERGLVDLDEDITRVLHEYQDLQILVGFGGDGEPLTRPAKNKLTLRHLLTHSSGIGYDFLSESIQRYRMYNGLSVLGKGESLMEWGFAPLLFEPGEGWAYGASMDWAGLVVERIGGHKSLEEYMSINIWEPLGMTSTSFRFYDRPEISSPEHFATLLNRNTEGRLGTETIDYSTKTYHFDGGGSGLFSRPTDFAKVLNSLLRNDGTVLKKETVPMMFQPQLPEEAQFLRQFLQKIPEGFRDAFLGGFPFEKEFNWGLGGLLAMEDVPGGRKKGSLSWGGMPNHAWWIDPSSKLYGFFATHMAPFGEKTVQAFARRYERALYQEFESTD